MYNWSTEFLRKFLSSVPLEGAGDGVNLLDGILEEFVKVSSGECVRENVFAVWEPRSIYSDKKPNEMKVFFDHDICALSACVSISVGAGAGASSIKSLIIYPA